MSYVVLKFGGTSVATAERWHTIAGVTRDTIAQGHTPFLVCSALAKIRLTEHTLAGVFPAHIESLGPEKIGSEARGQELSCRHDPSPHPRADLAHQRGAGGQSADRLQGV